MKQDNSDYLDWTDTDLFKADFSTNNPRIGNNLVVMQSNGNSNNEYTYNIDNLDLSDLAMHERARKGIGYLPQEFNKEMSNTYNDYVKQKDISNESIYKISLFNSFINLKQKKNLSK